MKFVTKVLTVILSILICSTACQRSAQKANESESDTTMLEKKDIEQGLKDLANPLPEPFEVYTILESIGASYLDNIMNSPENAETYFTQKSKSVNIGVYAADLAYIVTYNDKENIKIYSKVLKSILDDLGVSIDYTTLQNELINQKNLDKDTLIKYISQVYFDTYTFLNRESTPSLSALMAAGAWVEGLYIATHISEDTYQNYDIVKVIYDQGATLNGLIDFMGNFSDDEMVNSLQDAFKKLKVLYDETDGSLTEKQLEGIISTIETIRNSIIS